MKNLLHSFIIVLFLAVTLYSRFLNLNWDQGFGLHPDENNLWGASRQVKLFSKLDPDFYAYGGFPIYLYSLFDNKVQARTVSAVIQSVIVLLLFYLGKKLSGWIGGVFSAAMGTFSSGLVQAAHFLTVESLIGLCSLLVVTGLLNAKRRGGILLAAMALGVGIGTKISFLVFTLPFFALVLRSDLWLPKVRPLKTLLRFFLALSLAFFVFLLTNPYTLNRWESIRGTLTYEGNVATGKQSVFYTREFFNTIPGWFQVIHIFPYITGWGFMPLVLLGLFIALLKVGPWRTPRSDLIILLLAIVSAFLSFLPFWAKWTRYTVQVLPILILLAGVGTSWLWRRGALGRVLVFAAFMTFFPPFFSILRVYQDKDSRLAAADWAVSNIDNQSKIFTEGMDLGIVPFNSAHQKQITLFNFYELDEDKTGTKQKELQDLINKSDYFISVSERVYGNSFRRPDLFPLSATFYQSLFDGSLGFQKVYESDSPSTFYFLPSTLSSPEETISVFDHPNVMVFKKQS